MPSRTDKRRVADMSTSSCGCHLPSADVGSTGTSVDISACMWKRSASLGAKASESRRCKAAESPPSSRALSSTASATERLMSTMRASPNFRNERRAASCCSPLTSRRSSCSAASGCDCSNCLCIRSKPRDTRSRTLDRPVAASDGPCNAMRLSVVKSRSSSLASRALAVDETPRADGEATANLRSTIEHKTRQTERPTKVASTAATAATRRIGARRRATKATSSSSSSSWHRSRAAGLDISAACCG
mmetsp:Transcript_43536/g.125850  ORF Transcript_43536/g.125850 Transcript_43536/m.125850 type:complete len:246 (-) Transcript_43536:28-765(-)